MVRFGLSVYIASTAAARRSASRRAEKARKAQAGKGSDHLDARLDTARAGTELVDKVPGI